MAERSPFATDEWYHCYNRGVDKRTVFENTGDYKKIPVTTIDSSYFCTWEMVRSRFT